MADTRPRKPEKIEATLLAAPPKTERRVPEIPFAIVLITERIPFQIEEMVERIPLNTEEVVERMEFQILETVDRIPLRMLPVKPEIADQTLRITEEIPFIPVVATPRIPLMMELNRAEIPFQIPEKNAEIPDQMPFHNVEILAPNPVTRATTVLIQVENSVDMVVQIEEKICETPFHNIDQLPENRPENAVSKPESTPSTPCRIVARAEKAPWNTGANRLQNEFHAVDNVEIKP